MFTKRSRISNVEFSNFKPFTLSKVLAQLTFTCSTLVMKTLEKSAKYVQSLSKISKFKVYRSLCSKISEQRQMLTYSLCTLALTKCVYERFELLKKKLSENFRNII